MAKVTTAGDAGDCVYTLAILRDLPNGPHEFLIEPIDKWTASGKTPEAALGLLALVHDLVASQPYIKECRMMEPGEEVYWRSGGFRDAGLHRRTEPLMMAHLAHLNQTTGIGLKVDTSLPWLSVNGDERGEDRVVINRTFRYNNPRFQWAEVVKFYGKRLLFVGLPHEHARFCMDYGQVEFAPTKDLLEVARIIKSSRLFIGNQSCAGALSEGLKHHHIQETSLYIPDCVFKRDNVQHVWDGAMTLPGFGGYDDLTIRPHGLDIGLVSTMKTPPFGWKFPGVADYETFQQCVDQVAQLHTMRGKTIKFVEDAIKQANLDRCPEYYKPSSDGINVKSALAFAGYHQTPV